MTVQELANKLEQVEDKSVPVCLQDSEDCFISWPVEATVAEFVKGDKSSKGVELERKDRFSIDF